MTIRQSRETLPRTPQDEGCPPDPEPRFIPALLNKWYEGYLAAGLDEKATANGSLLRGSDAGACSRQISYELRRRRGDAGMERTNPTTVADAYRFNIGTLVHEVFQDSLRLAYPGATVEVVGIYEDPDLSLHADAVIDIPKETHARQASLTDQTSYAASGPQSPERLLDVAGGDIEADGLRNDRGRRAQGNDGSPGGLGSMERPDAGGIGDGSSVPQPSVLQSSPPGSGDRGGEQPPRDGVLGSERRQDSVPEGTPVRSAPARAEGMQHLRERGEAGVIPPRTSGTHRIALELKTTNGFAFKMQTTSGRTPPEGPRLSAVLQGAMAALAFDADELVVAVLSLELLSPREAAKQGVDETGRCGAEWTYPREQYEPMARAELARLGAILERVHADLPVSRVIPGLTPLGAEVVDPSSGRWELRDPDGRFILDSGTAWACAYCSHQDRCAIDKAAGN